MNVNSTKIMDKTENQNMIFDPTDKPYGMLKYHMAFGFSFAFLVVIFIITISLLYQGNNILTQKVLSLSSDLAEQIDVALTAKIQESESRMDVLFLPLGSGAGSSSTGAPGALPANAGGPPDPQVVFQSRFSALQNFTDFAIASQDGSVIGKISEESLAALGKPLYSVLAHALSTQEEQSGWITAEDLTSENVYYLRRKDEQSIIIESFPIKEIAHCLSNTHLSNGLVTRIVAPNGLLLYSSIPEELGRLVDITEVSILYSRLDNPQITDNQLSVIKRCCNGWLISVSADTADILQERKSMLQFVLIVIFLAAGFIIVFCIVFSMNLTMPIERVMKRLYNQSIRDSETKLYQKEYFGMSVRKMIDSQISDKYALIQLDIDNFKQMHDMRGNTFCSRIIKELADAMFTVFPEEAVLGRIGHDRFMIFTRLPGDSFQTIHHMCLSVQDSFRERVEKTENTTGISISAGIVLVPEHGTDFDLICELSDRAVHSIKKQGKNGYHIYTPDDDVDMWR